MRFIKMVHYYYYYHYYKNNCKYAYFYVDVVLMFIFYQFAGTKTGCLFLDINKNKSKPMLGILLIYKQS